MKIIDHGVWVKYKPDKPRAEAPANAMYMRRESDGVDWYDYVRPNFYQMFPRPQSLLELTGETEPLVPNFKPDSLICNVSYHEHLKAHVVGAAVRDPTAVAPINQRVIEIVGFDGDDPQAEFGGKVYDHEAGTFSKLVIPPAPPSPLEQKILDRLDAIEARLEKLERMS
jgi:hypothetical protein